MTTKETVKKGTRCALLVATPQCVVRFANPDARHWLNQFFDAPVRKDRLPEKICRWLTADGGKAALVVTLGAARLIVRRYLPHPRDAIALLLELAGEKSPAIAGLLYTLTRRENEVLGWIAAGKANSVIGQILHIAGKTVDKHVERILAKLYVENRAAAAAVYLASSGDITSGGFG